MYISSQNARCYKPLPTDDNGKFSLISNVSSAIDDFSLPQQLSTLLVTSLLRTRTLALGVVASSSPSGRGLQTFSHVNNLPPH